MTERESTHGLPAGMQRVIDGKTWTLARYDLAMWVPTEDRAEAQQALADHVADRLGPVYQDLDPARLKPASDADPSPLDVGRFTHLTQRAEQQRVTAELEQAFQQDDPQR